MNRYNIRDEKGRFVKIITCSFCKVNIKEVKLLIENPKKNAYICENCIGQCIFLIINKL